MWKSKRNLKYGNGVKRVIWYSLVHVSLAHDSILTPFHGADCVEISAAVPCPLDLRVTNGIDGESQARQRQLWPFVIEERSVVESRVLR